MSDKKIYLTNTLSRSKELFVPLQKGAVGIYHCGPTVYWNQHIGNIRAVVLADVIRRTFEFAGYKTTLIRNYTDVGHLTGDNIGDADSGVDRMSKASERENLTPERIAKKYIEAYEKDVSQLGVEAPSATPKATEYIEDMIELVRTLLKEGHAYTTDLAVYFDIETYKEYTALSGQKIEENQSGSGHGSVNDPQKKHPADFALWFFKAGAHAHALQTWKSPFTSPLVADGEGFPGWHIECSAMSKHFLGPTFDIHIGGIEHIPVHHTNEIAQSVCANHAPYATYWLHNEHLLVDNKKMSKSEGTSYLVSDIVDKGFDPIALRYFFLQAHYRSKQNFTWESLQASATAFKRLVEQVAQLPDSDTFSEEYANEYVTKFETALFDDFNTSSALSIIWEILKDTEVSPANKKATILYFDTVLGLQIRESIGKVQKMHSEKTSITVTPEIEALLEERKQARIHKDWITSDKIRDILYSKGYGVTDIDGEQIVTHL